MKTVRIEMHVNPAISGADAPRGRVAERLTRRSGTWTPSLDRAFRKMARDAELRYGNGGARVCIFVNDREETGWLVVGQPL